MSQLQVSGEAKIRDIQGPVVANSGVITALDGAASQYVRGDGTLADFPTSTGGGSSVSYYLNSSVSQGTIGGVAYRELSKEPIIGAGTDITISANGYVASYITDANDPDVLSVPGGNFNCEFYFSVNNNTGNPTTYAELYKYDGTTFTLLGSSVAVPESLNQGTTIAPYYFAIPVATAALALTDRLAIRIYVSVDGRVVTLHTENSHLCQVVTTFSKGMVSLNNLTDQSQFITTGTSGTNFNIVSSGDTHTFNLPVASATNTGKLSNTDWSTFNAKQPAGNYVTLDTTQTITAEKTFSVSPISESGYSFKILASGTPFQNGYSLISSLAGNVSITQALSAGNLKAFTFDFSAWATNTTRTYTLPDLSGTLALLEGSQTFSGAKTFSGGASFTLAGGIVGFSGGVAVDKGTAITKGSTPASFSPSSSTLYSALGDNNLIIRDSTNTSTLQFQASGSYTYTFPASSGTLALTSNLSAYLPLTGGTLTGNLTINPSTTDYTLTVSTSTTNNTIKLLGSTASNTSTIGYWSSNGGTGYGALNFTPTNTRFEIVNGGSFSIYTSGNERLTIASTGAVNLGTNELTSGNVKINDTLYLKVATTYAHVSGYYGIQVGTNLFTINNSASTQAAFSLASLTTSRTFTLPDASGTIALTSNLSAYLPLTGGTLTGALSGTSATFSGIITGSRNDSGNVSATLANAYLNQGNLLNFQQNNGGSTLNAYIGHGGDNTGNFIIVNNGITPLTLAKSTGAATFSSSVTSAALTIGSLGSGSNAVLTLATNASGSPRTIYYKASDATINITGTGGTDLMTITNGGNVGIGTSSPGNFSGVGFTGPFLDVAGVLQVKGTSANGVAIIQLGGDTYRKATIETSIGTQDPYIAFGTSSSGSSSSGTERMRITSSGNVGIGTSSPLQTAANRVVTTINGTNSAILNLAYSGTLAGYLYADNSNYTELYSVGQLALLSNASQPMTFSTNGSERMRIDSLGQCLFNVSTGYGAETIQLTSRISGGTQYGIIIQGNAVSYGQYAMRFVNQGVAVVGSITFTTTATAYNTSSDYRLKEDFKDFNALDIMSKIKFYDFKWKAEDSRMVGVKAHELKEIVPYAVNGEKDAIDEKGNPTYQGVDYSKLVAIQGKAIQELHRQIEELKALINK